MPPIVPLNNETQVSLSVLGDQPYPSFELRNILRYLNQHQPEAYDDLLQHIGLSQQQLNEDFIPAFKVLAAFKYCSDRFGPLAGAQIGCTYQVSDLGVFGYAVASSKTLDHVLYLADKYNSLLGNLLKRSALLQDDVLISKLYNVQNIDDDTLAFFVALSTSARLHVARGLFGQDLNFASLSLTSSDEVNQQAYEKIFGCKVTFNASHNSWGLHKEDLTRRHNLTLQNSDDQNQYLPYCNELMNSLKQKDSLVNEIQHILISCAGDYPDIEMLASAFKISSRTLRRQLSNLGTSYQKILNKVRCQLSIEYLSHTEISIEDISNLIGFSDVTNFRHAFKKWVGNTPSVYRKTYQGNAVNPSTLSN